MALCALRERSRGAFNADVTDSQRAAAQRPYLSEICEKVPPAAVALQRPSGVVA